MIIIGIDPGLNGAIAILEGKKSIVYLICQLWQKEKE